MRGLPPRTVVLLKPGETVSYWIGLDLRGLPKGEYDVQVEYFAEMLLGAPMNLTSNEVRFAIE